MLGGPEFSSFFLLFLRTWRDAALHTPSHFHGAVTCKTPKEDLLGSTDADDDDESYDRLLTSNFRKEVGGMMVHKGRFWRKPLMAFFNKMSYKNLNSLLKAHHFFLKP